MTITSENTLRPSEPKNLYQYILLGTNLVTVSKSRYNFEGTYIILPKEETISMFSYFGLKQIG